MHKQHEIYMKYTYGQRQKTQRHLYSTDWRRGLASEVTPILGLASGVTPNIPTCWYILVLPPTPSPDASSFASRWNIGFSFYFKIKNGQLLHFFFIQISIFYMQENINLDLYQNFETRFYPDRSREYTYKFPSG